MGNIINGKKKKDLISVFYPQYIHGGPLLKIFEFFDLFDLQNSLICVNKIFFNVSTKIIEEKLGLSRPEKRNPTQITNSEATGTNFYPKKVLKITNDGADLKKSTLDTCLVQLCYSKMKRPKIIRNYLGRFTNLKPLHFLGVPLLTIEGKIKPTYPPLTNPAKRTLFTKFQVEKDEEGMHSQALEVLYSVEGYLEDVREDIHEELKREETPSTEKQEFKKELQFILEDVLAYMKEELDKEMKKRPKLKDNNSLKSFFWFIIDSQSKYCEEEIAFLTNVILEWDVFNKKYRNEAWETYYEYHGREEEPVSFD